MKHYVETISIWKLMQKMDRINLRPHYLDDRKNWSINTCRSFIEGILSGYDSPKLYFALRSTDNYDMDVIDGTQRLEAISKFMNNEFSIDLASIHPMLRDISFQALSNSSELMESFWDYPLTLVEYDSDDVGFLKCLRQFISRRPDYLNSASYVPKRLMNSTLPYDITVLELNDVISEAMNRIDQTSWEKKNVLPYTFTINHDTNEEYQNEQDNCKELSAFHADFQLKRL